MVFIKNFIYSPTFKSHKTAQIARSLALSGAETARQCQAVAERLFPLGGRRLQFGTVPTAPSCPHSVFSPLYRWHRAHKVGGPHVSVGGAGDRRASPPDLARKPG